MSVLEMVRTKVKELTDPNGPANGLLQSAKSAVSHGLDGASKFVDEKTNGKYTSQINTGVHKAKEFLGEDKGEGQGEGGGHAEGEGHAEQKPTGAASAESSSAESSSAQASSAEGSAGTKPAEAPAEASSAQPPQPQPPKPPESNEPPQT